MNSINKTILKWSSITCILTFLIWIFSFIAISLREPLFFWSGIEDYIKYIHSNDQVFQNLAKAFMLVFAIAFFVLVSALSEYSSNERKLAGKLATGFALGFLILSGMHYFVQVTAVRWAEMPSDLIAIEQFLQAKPTSAMSSVNMLAWSIFLGLSALFLYVSIKGIPGSRQIRISNMILMVSAFMTTIGFLSQTDILTFIGVNLGAGGGLLYLSIASLRMSSFR